MKLIIKKNVPTDVEIDVQFPIYLSTADSTESSWWNSVCRIREDGEMVTLTKRGYWSAETDFELEIEQINIAWNLHRYLFADGYYHTPVSAADFTDLLTEFETKLKVVA